MSGGAIAVLFSLLANQAFGFEKSGLWDAKSAALAGTSVLSTGPISLYLNPAGLVGDEVGQKIVFGVSPTITQFQAPINNSNSLSLSTPQTDSAGGLIYGYNVTPNFGFGIGGYAVGGGTFKYENIEFPGYQGSPVNAGSKIKISEMALGLAYRLHPDLQLGLSARATQFSMAISTPFRVVGGWAMAVPELEDLNGDAQGYKVGMIYRASRRLQFSFTYRSEENFNLKGKLKGGKLLSPALTAQLEPANASLMTTLPSSYSLGVAYRNTPKTTLIFELVAAEYSKLNQFYVVTDSSLVGSRSVVLNLKNVVTGKLAIETDFMGRTWRMGYAQSSQMADTAYVRALGLPPAPLHTFSLGTGFTIGQRSKMDVAFDYSVSKGDGGSGPPGDSAIDSRQGTYTAEIVGFHLSCETGW